MKIVKRLLQIIHNWFTPVIEIKSFDSDVYAFEYQKYARDSY